jgi:hypothetical protein
MAADMLKFQATTVGASASGSFGSIGFIDKLAMSDQ